MRFITATVVAAVLYVPAGASAQISTSNVIGQSTDNIFWTEQGKFPAYPEEPDTRRWVFSGSGGLYHDSNIFRLSDSVNPLTALGNTDRSDNIARVGLGLKGRLPIEQQRVLIDLQADAYKFDRYSRLDNIAYNANATWKWQVTSQWSGNLGYGRQSFLAPFGEIQSPVRDMITVDHAFGDAGFMLSPSWRLRGGLDWYRYEHGDVSLASADNRTTSVTGGLDYVTSATNSVGGQVKYTDGQYPNQQFVAGSFVDNKYRELETSAVAHWIVSGLSTLDVRAGYTSRTHSQLSQRDFSGFTGRVTYGWTPGAKTLLNFSLYREIQAYQFVFASYVVAKGISIGPNWAPTAKVVVQPRFVYEKRSFDGNPGFVQGAGPLTEDIFRGVTLAVGYTPRRFLEFAVGAQKGNRTSNTFGRDYDYTAVYGNAKLSF